MNSKKQENNSVLEDTIKYVVETGETSLSKIQVKFNLGKMQTGLIMDELTDLGVVSAFNGNTKREVLIQKKDLGKVLDKVKTIEKEIEIVEKNKGSTISGDITEHLNKLKSLYGTKDVVEKLRLYNKYINMKAKGDIKFGNLNIFLNCQRRDETFIETIEAINTILINHKIVEGDYLELQMRTKPEEIEAKKLYLIDEEEDLNYESMKIRKVVNKKPDTVFVIATGTKMKEPSNGGLIMFGSRRNNMSFEELQKFFYWDITIDKQTDEEKKKYIKKQIKECGFSYKKGETFLNELVQKEMYEINQKLMEAFLEASISKKQILEDSFFKVKKEEEVVHREKETGLEKLEKLTGLEDVKKQIKKIANYVEIHKERKSMPMLHMCMSGNPGTGKTTVARIIGEIFSDLRHIK